MKDRIRQLRENLNMSRAAFGEKLGISGDVVNNMERGRIEIKEDRIKLICSIFDVNEAWLRTGEGDMTIKRSRNQEILAYANKVMDLPNNNIQKRLIEALIKLDSEDWKAIEQIAEKLLKEG